VITWKLVQRFLRRWGSTDPGFKRSDLLEVCPTASLRGRTITDQVSSRYRKQLKELPSEIWRRLRADRQRAEALFSPDSRRPPHPDGGGAPAQRQLIANCAGAPPRSWGEMTIPQLEPLHGAPHDDTTEMMGSCRTRVRRITTILAAGAKASDSSPGVRSFRKSEGRECWIIRAPGSSRNHLSTLRRAPESKLCRESSTRELLRRDE